MRLLAKRKKRNSTASMTHQQVNLTPTLVTKLHHYRPEITMKFKGEANAKDEA